MSKNVQCHSQPSSKCQMARSTARRLGDVKHPEGHQRITERSCRNPSHISNHKTGKWWEIHGNILISNVANLVATSIYINPVWHDSQGRTLNSLDTAPQKRRKPFWRLEPRFAGTARVAQLCCKVSSLLDRAQRRERPLDKCCSTRRTAWENAAFQATTAFPILQLWSKITKDHIFLRGLEWVCFAHPALLCSMSLLVQFIDFDIPSTDVYHIYHERNCPQRRPRGLLKHRSRSGKPLALTGISGKGWGNRGASLSKLDKLFPNEIHSAAALTREVFPSQVRLEHLALWIFHQFFHIGLQWLPSCFEFGLL